MKRLLSVVVGMAAVSGCGDKATKTSVDAPVATADVTTNMCATGHADKLKFAYASSCANDGGVEFCIPDNDAATLGAVTAVSSTITCSAGGGRAMCSATPGLLLCSYPTSFPAQCTTQYGTMTDQVWADMCQLAAVPQISQIVPTILE